MNDTMNRCLKSALALGALGVVVAGCGAAPAAAEKTEVSDEALGEAACGTQALGATATAAGQVIQGYFHCGSDNSARSANASYGTTACPNQYTLEIDFPGTWVNTIPPSRFFAGSATPITDQATCTKFESTLSLWVHSPAGGWKIVNSEILGGQWQPASTGGGFTLPASCTLNVTSGGLPAWAAIPNHATVDKVRLVGAAYTKEMLKGAPYKAYRPVTLTLGAGGPC